MARLFVSSSPSQLNDQALAEHATALSKNVMGNRVVAVLIALLMGTLAYYFDAASPYLFGCGVAVGFYCAQSRLAVLAERIKRLEKQQQL